MRFFTQKTEVVLAPEIISKARQFALDVVKTTNYVDSNQINVQKVTDDHFVSKLGEEATWKVLSHYASVTMPDYEIYHGKEKSWQDDLFTENIGLAVKTMKRTAAMRFGLSWTFQCGALRRDKILDHPDAWVVFVEYVDIGSQDHCVVYPPFQIKELTFSEPELSQLKRSKKVVYEHHLPSL